MVFNLYNRAKVRLPFSHQQAEKMIRRATRTLRLKQDFELTVLLVGDKEIRKLNKKFRHKDCVTDVLSFSQREGGQIILPAKEANYLGDIVISYPRAKRQAKQFGHSIRKESELLLVHGFLHLLGYTDETKKDYLKMEKIQNKILNL